MTEVVAQLERAGLAEHLESWSLNGNTLLGFASPAFLEKLRADDRFCCGVFYGLHRDVGKDLQDFRAHRGKLGKGSLQIVIDTRTYQVYADVDRWSPYSDLVGVFGHVFGEVVPHFARKLFRRKSHG